MSFGPGILARGPWSADQVAVAWRDEEFVAEPEQLAAADEKIAALRDRGSPSHDGLAARLAAFTHEPGKGLALELQPLRWSLRLLESDTSASLSALCVVRDADGRFLAGRRAAWLASWRGRWALGAGGSVEVGESPVETLTRELEEEWSVRAERLQVEALVALPNRMVMLIGHAWLPPGAEVRPDDEHDAFAWWPADPELWPAEADAALRHMATLLT